MQKLNSCRFLKEFIALDICEEGFITLHQDFGNLVGKLQGIVLDEGLESDLELLIFFQGRLLGIEFAIRIGFFIEYSNDAEDGVDFVY